MKKAATFHQKLIERVNRKAWWHVPPRDPEAYSKRGKFYASTFTTAGFYGRPNDDPEDVSVERPLVGDEKTISGALGIPPQHADMTLEEIAEHDASWRSAALAKGYDSIVLMAPKAFARFKAGGRLPLSLELNVLSVQALPSLSGARDR
jgi:hypothetical protein